jgi:hypothetical protein
MVTSGVDKDSGVRFVWVNTLTGPQAQIWHDGVTHTINGKPISVLASFPINKEMAILGIDRLKDMYPYDEAEISK